MSIKVMSLVWEGFPASGSEMLAMLALADWCNDEGGSLHPSMKAVAEKIARIKARKAKIEGVRSLSLICNEQGQPLKKEAMRYRFDKARDAAASATKNKAQAERLRSIQFRDLRAKAASDMKALDKAQKLLGHTKREMTEHYVRKRRGEKVSPVK